MAARDWSVRGSTATLSSSVAPFFQGINAKFGEEVKAKGTYGKLMNPYTGELIAELKTERKGIVIPSGQEWPTIGNTSVGILGDVVQVVDRESADLKVSLL